MFKTLLIVIIGLLPPVYSVWAMRRNQTRTQAKLAARIAVARRQQPINLPPLERYYLEGVGYLIGDISCRFNARSGYLQCAVNPQGTCRDCRYYEPREP